MGATGVSNATQFANIKFAISEYEEELEQRDMSAFAKITQSQNFKHSEVACIGSKTCNKQKLVHRLYEDALKAIAASQPASSKPGQEVAEVKEE